MALANLWHFPHFAPSFERLRAWWAKKAGSNKFLGKDFLILSDVHIFLHVPLKVHSQHLRHRGNIIVAQRNLGDTNFHLWWCIPGLFFWSSGVRIFQSWSLLPWVLLWSGFTNVLVPHHDCSDFRNDPYGSYDFFSSFKHIGRSWHLGCQCVSSSIMVLGYMLYFEGFEMLSALLGRPQYAAILSPWASNFPVTCPTTNCESECTMTCFPPKNKELPWLEWPSFTPNRGLLSRASL